MEEQWRYQSLAQGALKVPSNHQTPTDRDVQQGRQPTQPRLAGRHMCFEPEARGGSVWRHCATGQPCCCLCSISEEEGSLKNNGDNHFAGSTTPDEVHLQGIVCNETDISASRYQHFDCNTQHCLRASECASNAGRFAEDTHCVRQSWTASADQILFGSSAIPRGLHCLFKSGLAVP